MDMSFASSGSHASCDIAGVALERLHRNPYRVLTRVSCECRNGVLYLRGRLFSFHEKQVAQEAVSAVRGVTRVVNEIEVA